jgi:putative acetyltransferase
MNFKIRAEASKDFEQVSAILRETFPTDAESKLVEMLRTKGKAILSLVAVGDSDEVLGHILFSPVSTAPLSDARGIGLAPVAIRPDVQSQGIGSELIHEGLCLCKQLAYDYCVVLGSPKYYHRFGFEKASNFRLQNEYGVDDEFMVIRLSKHGIVQGLIRYAPEFALLSL